MIYSPIAKPAMQLQTHSRLSKLCASLVIVTFLTSCVSNPAHKAALKKVKDGPVQEGVAKLKESSAKEPDVQAYRVDYLRERERAVNQMLVDATSALDKGNLNEASAKTPPTPPRQRPAGRPGRCANQAPIL